MPLSSLKPKSVWKLFSELNDIPRPSKHEGQVRDWIISKVQKLGLKISVDTIGNLVVRKPATKGFETLPIVILQSHMDMVCEKDPNLTFDFSQDGIKARIENGYVLATGTTLGADNGIGLCIALSILLDSSLKHGPLEALFTVDEETGLTGARELDSSLLYGRHMINLDSEQWGVITISSAGGGDTVLSKTFTTTPVDDTWPIFSLNIKGLHGGHSGIDIHLPKGNSIKILTRLLHQLGNDIRIITIDAGHKRNAIPRFASCTFTNPAYKKGAIQQIIHKRKITILNEWSAYEKSLDIALQLAPHSKNCLPDALSPEDSQEIIHLFNVLPHGPYRFSPSIPHLVETSNNLAIVHLMDGDAEIGLSSRSSVDSQIELQREVIQSTALLAGGWEIKQEPAYPGWAPDLNSNFLKFIQTQYKKVLSGEEPKLAAIHAGLETGVIGKHFDEKMAMVAIGPEIRDAHSPRERVEIESVQGIYRLVCEVLSNFPETL